MCGIAGFVSERPMPQARQRLQQMADSIAHRGPDADGFFVSEDGRTGLAHRRLSILDVSTAANQPLYSASGRHVVVFNGEVFNFSDIARKHGIQPRTGSDTEILLEAFERVGTPFIEDAVGMFALAFYDKLKGTSCLFRDRIGIKPVYIAQWPGLTAFASEPKALETLAKAEGLPLTRNPQALASYLNLGYVPGPLTMYREMRKLAPGHFVLLEPGNPGKEQPFWRLDDQLLPAHHYRDETQALNHLQELVEDAVRLRLISDVPLGCFLSGGTDSSLVTAIAQKLTPQPMKTFTIGFRYAKYDETEWAGKVARHLGTDHHTFMLEEDEAISYINRIPEAYDEPYASISAIPTLMVSDKTRQHVTVSLSGDGGDEGFLGYGMYAWAQRLGTPARRAAARMAVPLLRASGKPKLIRGADVMDLPAALPAAQHIFSQEQGMFRLPEIVALMADPVPPLALRTFGGERMARHLTPAEAQNLLDYRYYLPDDLLVKVDRASMTYALEVRVPLLDHRLVAFALNLPPELRMHPQAGMKYLLKNLLRRYLPDELVNRPKWGFPSPMEHWLRGRLRPMMEEVLHPDRIRAAGLVNPEPVQRLKQQFLERERPWLAIRLWNLIQLHEWAARRA